MSEIRDRDEFILTVNRLMICAMEDIDCGRNAAGPTTLDLVQRIEDHDAALRLALAEAIAHDRQPYPTAAAYEGVCVARDKWQSRAESAESRLAEAEKERDAEKRLVEEWGVTGANLLDRAESAESRLAEAEKERDSWKRTADLTADNCLAAGREVAMWEGINANLIDRAESAESRLAEAEGVLRDVLPYIENGDFTNGVTDQNGQSDQGSVWAWQMAERVQSFLAAHDGKEENHG